MYAHEIMMDDRWGNPTGMTTGEMIQTRDTRAKGFGAGQGKHTGHFKKTGKLLHGMGCEHGGGDCFKCQYKVDPITKESMKCFYDEEKNENLVGST